MTSDSRLPPDPVDWDAVARFFAGESSTAEIESVSQWLAERPEEAAAFASLHAVTRSVHQAETPIDVDAAWRRAVPQLDAPRAATVTERTPTDESTRRPARVYAFRTRRSVWHAPALRAAAAIALVAGGAALWQARSGDTMGGRAAAAQTFTTAPAQRDSVVLDDGTGVLLGPGSSLRTEAGYGDGARIVHLKGEALFDVRHDDARPFVVHTSDLLIHDLGTTFTVRTMNGAGGVTSIAVTVGAVRIARASPGADSAVVLRAGDRASVGAATIAVQRGVALDDELAFARGRLVFRDTPLPAVAAALRRWYGIPVEIGDEGLNGRTLTAAFEGESLAQVLEVIGLALDVPVRQADSVVVIGTRSTRAKSPE